MIDDGFIETINTLHMEEVFETFWKLPLSIGINNIRFPEGVAILYLTVKGKDFGFGISDEFIKLKWSPIGVNDFVEGWKCFYCDSLLSGARHLLLSNQWVNWIETLQKASCQWPRKNSFKFMGSMQNSGFHGNEMIKKIKILLLPNWLADFQIIL